MATTALAAVAEASITQFTVPIVGVELGQTAFTAIGIGLILVLLVGSGFFSSSEIAMFSLSDYQVDAMVEDGKRGARAIRSLKQDPHRLLVTILVGNNMVNITMSSVSTTIVGFYFDPGTAVLVSSLGITSMVLVFGESAPKSYAVDNTGSWARTVAPPLRIVGAVLWPLVTLFYHVTRLVNRVTPGSSFIDSSYVSREEIRNMVETGGREGVLDEDEQRMIQRALRFQDTVVKEVMTPRLDVEAISGETSVATAIEECMRSSHGRLPVYEGSLDNVIGVFDIREVDRNADTADRAVTDVVTPTLHVPESKNVDELLSEMRDNRLQMVVVVDEFGAVEGIVTMEDIVEEIVGEILMDDEERPIELLDDGEAVVRGEVNIEEVNEALNIDLPEGEEFETIAGFIFNRAGRLVQQGESFDYGNVTLRPERVEDTRIRKARVLVDPDTAGPVEAEPPASEETE